MIQLDYLDVGSTVASSPTVCMHCEDPIAPCAEVCPADAILVTADGVVQEASKERCIGCANCVHACPFGVPKLDVEEKLQYKCNLCYDRTSVGLAPMCATVCPTGSVLRNARADRSASSTLRAGQHVSVRAADDHDDCVHHDASRARRARSARRRHIGDERGAEESLSVAQSDRAARRRNLRGGDRRR